MSTWNGFRGAAKRLDDIDLPRIGARIGVGEDALHAFLDVESRGTGFDALGRPKVLFEPHVFWRNLPAGKRLQAQREGLAAPKWGAIPYGKESGQYERLERAMVIDETAALKACSWGLCQVLGENHRMVGYDTVQDMVRTFMEDEEHHLEACIRYIEAAGIDDDLRAHRWEVVARVYNGPQHAKHNYAGRMRAAYAKWARIKDTPWQPGREAPGDPGHRDPEGPSGPDAPAPVREFSNAEVRSLQERLRALGYFEVGKVDGLWGSKTIAAVAAFQASNALPVTVSMVPTLDADTMQKLAIAKRREVSQERAATTAEDLKAQGSSVVRNASSIDWASLGLIMMAVLECIVLAWQQYEANPLPLGVGLMLQMMGTPAWLLPVAQFAFAFYTRAKANAVIMARLQAERSGMHNGEADPAPSRPVTSAPEPTQGLPNVRKAWPFAMAGA